MTARSTSTKGSGGAGRGTQAGNEAMRMAFQAHTLAQLVYRHLMMRTPWEAGSTIPTGIPAMGGLPRM